MVTARLTKRSPFKKEIEELKLRNLYRRLTGSAQRPKLMRVDTPASYGDFVSRKAFKELITRVNDLRAAFEGEGPRRSLYRRRGVLADLLGRHQSRSR